MAGAALAGQAPDRDAVAAQQAAAAEAIRQFVDDYEREQLRPSGPLRRESGLQPRYARIAHRADVLQSSDLGALTHIDALNKLLAFAEHQPCEALGDAVLGVAAAGFERSLFDRDAMLLRDLGHWSLMRVDHQGVWFGIMRAAVGERLPLLTDGRDDAAAEALDPARRVAALKLLGMKGLAVFRSTIEGALGDLDPRVRLAAVEALDFQRRPESLSVLVRAMGVERHPVVSQAVVRAVLAVLDKIGDELPRAERDLAVQAAVRLFGRCGWRTDMDLLDLVERYPTKVAIPHLIGILERAATPADQLVELVNRSASPRLRNRAHECLAGMTGAIIPADQAAEWRAFWQRERDNIRVPDTLPKLRADGATASQFFGIPVTGREIAFVIDTSGSMKQQIGTVTGRRRDAPETRLAVAKEQLLLAVQAMEPESRYHLVTFAGAAQVWSRKAVPPGEQSTRSLTGLLSRFQADGGTNVYEGLAQALSLDELRYGEQGEKSIDELFLLSDGEPTSGMVTEPDQILALVREANKYLKVRINTVFAGTGKGADFLRRLAEENDGVFVQR